jgi:hypothetical protein
MLQAQYCGTLLSYPKMLLVASPERVVHHLEKWVGLEDFAGSV